MNIEKYTVPPTVAAIYDHYKSKRKGGHRPHLGGSQIGNECERALWYQFRWAWSATFDGRILRLFETGDREEGRMVANLRAVGVKVQDLSPVTGKQWSYSAEYGHFSLSLDGIGEGFPESKAPHTLEFKTMNEKNFAALKAKGVQVSKPVYWAQCQIGMHMSQMDRCFFMAVNKNTDELYAERIKYDPAEAMTLMAKAERIIFAPTPPSRISRDPSFFICRFCDYHPVCHGTEIPEVNCRTCAHSTPLRDGTWDCVRGFEMGIECKDHIFIPQALPIGWDVTDAGETWVEYKNAHTGATFRNEGNSREMGK